MGAIWKFFSGEDDAVSAPEQSVQRSPVWGLLTGAHVTSKPPERLAAAYHEAGHARAIRVGKGTVAWMEVDAHGGGGTMPEWSPRSELRDRLIAIVAGQESECQLFMDRYGHSYKKALEESDPHASTDRKIFKEQAKGSEYTFEGLRGEARRLVRRHAYTIETNAKPLDRRGRRAGTWA